MRQHTQQHTHTYKHTHLCFSSYLATVIREGILRRAPRQRVVMARDSYVGSTVVSTLGHVALVWVLSVLPRTKVIHGEAIGGGNRGKRVTVSIGAKIQISHGTLNID